MISADHPPSADGRPTNRPRQLSVRNPDGSGLEELQLRGVTTSEDRAHAVLVRSLPIEDDTFPSAEALLPHHRPYTFPQISPSHPLLTRLNLRGRALLHRFSIPQPITSPAALKTNGPTFTKTYPARPGLPVQIYIPPPSTSQPGPLPLYIHIVPISFLGGDRQKLAVRAAEHFAARLAYRHGICVASVSFRDPPRWLFPTQIYDVVAILQEILGGTGLPIDRRKVAIGGFGAGASVALGVVQTEEMKGVIRGVLAICPLVDWAIPVADKTASVQSGKHILATVTTKEDKKRLDEESKKQDHLSRRNNRQHELLSYSYIPPRQELTDPKLSPAYAPRASMPRHVFLVGAQHDILCAETERLALRLATDEHDSTVGDEESWTSGTVKWEKVIGWGSGFVFRTSKDGKEEERENVANDLFDRIGDWLWALVYA